MNGRGRDDAVWESNRSTRVLESRNQFARQITDVGGDFEKLKIWGNILLEQLSFGRIDVSV